MGWNWNSVAKACTDQLDPAGSGSGYDYSAVPYGYGDFHHPGDRYCNDDDWTDTA
ncbi:hypothetical protein amrb99_83680 [Actinomadura sp. RB99]|uniref:hypothetical protein n=1 Tax=Actinomadura sp. RB99 TaxID=2691577 RepID=UPI001985A682|nr:hypothetical protein [Actinomadura sp. RB99]MBD2899385.1 hypothetical protein [Actinomadura sp. RB99]